MALVSATSGAVASAVSEIVVFPLNSIKIKAQAAIGSDSSPLAVARRCLRDEGVLGFYRGVHARVLQQCIAKFVMFFTKSAVLAEWRKRFGKLTAFQQLLVGMLAEIPNTIFLLPLDCVCNLVVKSKATPPPTMVEVARRVHAEHGVSGFWRGWMFSLLLCSNPAIQFSGFDIVKAWYLRRRKRGARGILTWGEAFAIGAIAKAIATVVTFPAIRFKILLQTAAKQQTMQPPPSQRSTAIDDEAAPLSPRAAPATPPATPPPSPLGSSPSRVAALVRGGGLRSRIAALKLEVRALRHSDDESKSALADEKHEEMMRLLSTLKLAEEEGASDAAASSSASLPASASALPPASASARAATSAPSVGETKASRSSAAAPAAAPPRGSAVAEMLAREGPSGLYKGVTPQLVKGVIASALLLGVKEKIAGVVARSFSQYTGGMQ